MLNIPNPYPAGVHFGISQLQDIQHSKFTPHWNSLGNFTTARYLIFQIHNPLEWICSFLNCHIFNIPNIQINTLLDIIRLFNICKILNWKIMSYGNFFMVFKSLAFRNFTICSNLKDFDNPNKKAFVNLCLFHTFMLANHSEPIEYVIDLWFNYALLSISKGWKSVFG